MPINRTCVAPALLVASALLAACSAGPATPTAPPRPTEHRLDDDAERDNKSRRKAWMEQMHRAPPDVDWRAVERASGEAQRLKRNRLASMKALATRWTELGSRNQAGRMHVAAPAPDGLSLYAGSSLGGVWHGSLDGQDWEPLGDNIYGGAHWLAVVPGPGPADPDVVLRATDGGLIHVTRDGGATWEEPAGFPTVVGVRRVLVTTDGSHTIFIVLRHYNHQGALKYSLYRSTDAALTFSKIVAMDEWAGDAWAPRDGGPGLWLLADNALKVSQDLGDSFSLVGTLPVTASGGELTASEAGAPRFWAVLDAGGKKLYRSDGGANWFPITDISDYWGSLNASILDPELFAYGGVEVWRTANGGASFLKVNNWYDYYGDPANRLHADIPGIDVVPDGTGGEIWYVSTDGGLYRSTDGLATVENLSLNGLRVSQYYTTHTSTANPLHVIAGSQDQGYQRAKAPPPDPDNGLLNFNQLISGDYGHATSGDGSHQYVFSVYPGFLLIQKGETGPQLFTADFPSGSTHGWLPTITADPLDVTATFFCGDNLWRYRKSTVFVNTWEPVLWSGHDFGANPGEYLSALVFSPLDSQRAYAATSWGRLFRSDDQGQTWTESANSGPGQHYFYGNAMVASSQDVDTAWVGGSGYGGPAVKRTTDGGLTWQAWDDGLPDTLVYSLAEAPDGSGALFAGTEQAAWRRDPGGAWTDITANQAPITIYWSAEAVPSANSIRFGTYGRGIWDYLVEEPCIYEAYGVGLGGTNTLTLDSASATTLGTTHVLELSGALPLSPAWLLYSPNDASLPFKGGTLLVDPGTLLALPITTDILGEASLPLQMPADPLFAGWPLRFQVALQWPLGWALSNGLQGTLCE
jgi:photosystem II stability/assembly factor-like uncharacterized protein